MVRRRRNFFKVSPDQLLLYISGFGKVTRASTSRDHPQYTLGQVTYWLDKLHQQRKLRRHRGPDGAFVYAFRQFWCARYLVQW